MTDVAEGTGVPTLAQLRARRQDILAVAGRRGARNMRVLGSVARGEANQGSDVDFLIDLEPGHGLLALGGLYADLCALLGREVDVGTETSLRENVRKRVLAEAVPL